MHKRPVAIFIQIFVAAH